MKATQVLGELTSSKTAKPQRERVLRKLFKAYPDLNTLYISLTKYVLPNFGNQPSFLTMSTVRTENATFRFNTSPFIARLTPNLDACNLFAEMPDGTEKLVYSGSYRECKRYAKSIGSSVVQKAFEIAKKSRFTIEDLPEMSQKLIKAIQRDGNCSIELAYVFRIKDLDTVELEGEHFICKKNGLNAIEFTRDSIICCRTGYKTLLDTIARLLGLHYLPNHSYSPIRSFYKLANVGAYIYYIRDYPIRSKQLSGLNLYRLSHISKRNAWCVPVEETDLIQEVQRFLGLIRFY